MDLPGQARHRYVEPLLKNYLYDYLIGRSNICALRLLHGLHISCNKQILSVTPPGDQLPLLVFPLVLGVRKTCTTSVQQHHGNGRG